jgi:hypothetical protein
MSQMPINFVIPATIKDNALTQVSSDDFTIASDMKDMNVDPSHFDTQVSGRQRSSRVGPIKMDETLLEKTL